MPIFSNSVCVTTFSERYDERVIDNYSVKSTIAELDPTCYIHGQVRAGCSRPVASLLWNVVDRPHVRCVRAVCCGLSSHACYRLSSDLLQTVATELQQCCWKQTCCILLSQNCRNDAVNRIAAGCSEQVVTDL